MRELWCEANVDFTSDSSAAAYEAYKNLLWAVCTVHQNPDAQRAHLEESRFRTIAQLTVPLSRDYRLDFRGPGAEEPSGC